MSGALRDLQARVCQLEEQGGKPSEPPHSKGGSSQGMFATQQSRPPQPFPAPSTPRGKGGSYSALAGSPGGRSSFYGKGHARSPGPPPGSFAPSPAPGRLRIPDTRSASRTAQPENADERNRRAARLVIGRFAPPLAKQEVLDAINDVCVLPRECFVLQRSLYSVMSTIVFPSADAASTYLNEFRSQPRYHGEARLFIGREKTLQQQRLGFVLRESRRQMESQGVPKKTVEIEERSGSIFVNRMVVAFVKDGELQVTREWSRQLTISHNDFLAAMSSSLG
eukprot:6487540-Amphidinium_carterae.2